jgi:hypothetical protein
MIYRHLTAMLLRDLNWSPIIGLVGSRQVGKTTLAQHIRPQLPNPSIYLDLELQDDWRKLEFAQEYLGAHADKTVIIDEVQVRPELFPLLRGLIDQDRRPGRFILLGSASPHLIRQNTETLAGRIAYHELSPFSYSEIKGTVSLEKHWLMGGFPGALLAPSPVIARKWMSDFTDTFIFRDLLRLGFTIPEPLLRNLLSMLSHLNGNLLNVADLAKSLGVTQPTVQKYLELLEGSFLLRRLAPYFSNASKRLVKSPKVYLRDTGLLHNLFRTFDLEALQGHPGLGHSWEGYVIEQVIREAPEFSDFFFYRTQNGAEIDLLIQSPGGRLIGIEVKYGSEPSISKGFHQSRQDLGLYKAYVITLGSEVIRRDPTLMVCPLAHFLTEELPLIE